MLYNLCGQNIWCHMICLDYYLLSIWCTTLLYPWPFIEWLCIVCICSIAFYVLPINLTTKKRMYRLISRECEGLAKVCKKQPNKIVCTFWVSSNRQWWGPKPLCWKPLSLPWVQQSMVHQSPSPSYRKNQFGQMESDLDCMLQFTSLPIGA